VSKIVEESAVILERRSANPQQSSDIFYRASDGCGTLDRKQIYDGRRTTCAFFCPNCDHCTTLDNEP
jgi:hypothetical protein